MRSAVFVAAYLMWAESLVADEAVRVLRLHRPRCFSAAPCDRPYLHALAEWESELRGERASTPPAALMDALLRAAVEEEAGGGPDEEASSERGRNTAAVGSGSTSARLLGAHRSGPTPGGPVS